MFALLTSIVGLILPVPPVPPAVIQPTSAPLVQQSPRDLVFPTTAAIAEFDKTDVGQTFQGGTDTIPMTSLLDEVPVDIGGDAGAAKDEAGVARLKEREAAKEAVTNEDRAATFEAKQAEGLKLPSLPKFGLSF